MPPLSPREHSNSQSLNNGLAIFSIHRLGSRVETSFQTPTISQIHYETQKNKCFPKFPCNGILLVLLFQAVYIFPVHKFGLDPGETELLSLVPFFSKPIDKAYSLNQTADVSLLCSKYLYLYLGLNLGHGHGLHCKLVSFGCFFNSIRTLPLCHRNNGKHWKNPLRQKQQHCQHAL